MTRLVQCWEYLFQFLVQHGFLHEETLPSKSAREDLVTLAGYDLDFEPEEAGGWRVAQRNQPLRRAIADMVARRRNVEYVRTGKRAEQFFEAMRKTYASTAWVNELKSCARHPATRHVREIRDRAGHVSLLFARAGVIDHGIAGLPGSGLGVSEPKWSVKEVQRALDDAHPVLKQAIIIVREALFNGLVPNRKETEGHIYHVHVASCPYCGLRLTLPCPDPIFDHFGHRICPQCGLWSQLLDEDLSASLPTTEWGHATLVTEYVDAANRYLHRLDPQWISEHVEGASSDAGSMD